MKRAIFLLALAGCPDPERAPQVWLHGVTGAPPTGRAVVRNDDHGATYAIELSTGVAIAASCTNNCTGTCTPAVTVADPDILDVRPVYRVNGSKGHVALIAKQAGATSLVVEDECSSRTYFVQVTPP